MLSTAEFKDFARDHVLFCHVTTHLEGDKYPDLLKEKGGGGWPYVVAMDAEGRILANLPGRSVDAFGTMMKTATEFAGLAAKKDRSPAEELRLMRLELQVDRLADADARTRIAALKGLDDAGKADRDDLVVCLDMEVAVKPVNETRWRDAAARIEAGKTFAEMWKAGRAPLDPGYAHVFYVLIFDHAEAAKDAALFEKALAKFREVHKDIPAPSAMFTKPEERLKRLKEAAAPK